MTNEEALKNMDSVEDIVVHNFGGYPYTEEEENILIAVDMAKIALKKQIPKKPVVYHDGNPNHLKAYECPVCGGQLVSEFDKWCRECGQKIDWE